ncbi:MAG: DUF1501 domain-containing protein [Acidimicrobiia bacterium]|nr:DUF1501 domain-containing protein [Acidimicrobiia bacterium]
MTGSRSDAPHRGAALSRRRFLGWSAAAGTGMALGSTGARLAFAEPNDPASGDTLVVVFLRGGADGLSLVAPVADGAYHDARPTVAVPTPDVAGGGLPADDRFAFHPGFDRLYDTAWAEGHLAVVHAVGLPSSTSSTRSHFQAQDFWQRASADPAVRDGWAARLLASAGVSGALPAVALQSALPASLRGLRDAVSMNGPDSFQLEGLGDAGPAHAALRTMYAGVPEPLGGVATRLLEVLDVVAAAQPGAIPPADGVVYPDSRLAEQLAEVGQLIRADVGLRFAAVETGGWDTHDDMGSVGGGRMATQAAELGDALAAFHADLGPSLSEVTLVTMSEFGRTTRENGSGGTDHGRGSTMLVLGGAVNRGIYTDWPGLGDADGERDLDVTIDYRAVLSEVVRTRFGDFDAETVFPGVAAGTPLGIVRS